MPLKILQILQILQILIATSDQDQPQIQIQIQIQIHWKSSLSFKFFKFFIESFKNILGVQHGQQVQLEQVT